MTKGIPISHAPLIHKGEKIIPKRGVSRCSPACLVFELCLNYEEGELCSNYKPMENGKLTMRMLENLEDSDKIYFANTTKFIQRCLDNGDVEDAEIYVNDVKRFFKPNEATIKKITKVYDDEKLYSVKEEKVENLEPPEHVNISLFGDWHVSSDRIKKPKPPEPTPSHYDERLSERVKKKLTELGEEE
jgi:hypothetical protein